MISGFAVTFTFPQGSEVGLGTKSGTSRPSVAVWNSLSDGIYAHGVRATAR